MKINEYIKAVSNREEKNTIQDLEWVIQCLNDTISDIQKGKITVDEIPEAYRLLINNNNNRNLHWNELQQEYREE
tara:strand:- start:17 stop:241 length:225 start_codon:yes stop_codon:yes gene_type:complete